MRHFEPSRNLIQNTFSETLTKRQKDQITLTGNAFRVKYSTERQKDRKTERQNNRKTEEQRGRKDSNKIL